MRAVFNKLLVSLAGLLTSRKIIVAVGVIVASEFSLPVDATVAKALVLAASAAAAILGIAHEDAATKSK